MHKIIFVPQYPTPMRYQEWWFDFFPVMFKHHGFEVVTLGKDYVNTKAKPKDGMFSSIDTAIEFETEQIREYMKLTINPKEDILFLADVSFPGFFPQVLHHKKPEKVFGFCHATSLNYADYFAPTRPEKWLAELSTMDLCKKVFVGSEYHKKKLDLKNTMVTALPFPDVTPSFNANRIIKNRKYDIVSVSRPSIQKIDIGIENEVEKRFGEITRKEFESWFSYYEFLADSKILFVSGVEETFGYQIVDGIINGCVVLAPNRCSYPELLSSDFIYNSTQDAINKIDKILNGSIDLPIQAPSLKCKEQMINFFNTLTEEFKK